MHWPVALIWPAAHWQRDDSGKVLSKTQTSEMEHIKAFFWSGGGVEFPWRTWRHGCLLPSLVEQPMLIAKSPEKCPQLDVGKNELEGSVFRDLKRHQSTDSMRLRSLLSASAPPPLFSSDRNRIPGREVWREMLFFGTRTGTVLYTV